MDLRCAARILDRLADDLGAFLLDDGRGDFVADDLYRDDVIAGTDSLGGDAIDDLVAASDSFEGSHDHLLALDDNLARHNAEARCGLIVVDLRGGDIVHWFGLEGVVSELYDVAVLPGVQRPMALGFKSEEIRRTVTIGDAS